MKTAKILTASMLIISSITAFANPDSLGKPDLSAPEFVWGNPEDINKEEIEALKSIPSSVAFRAPEFVWGDPSEINEEEIEGLKDVRTYKVPVFISSNPDDINKEEIEKLKNL